MGDANPNLLTKKIFLKPRLPMKKLFLTFQHRPPLLSSAKKPSLWLLSIHKSVVIKKMLFEIFLVNIYSRDKILIHRRSMANRIFVSSKNCLHNLIYSKRLFVEDIAKNLTIFSKFSKTVCFRRSAGTNFKHIAIPNVSSERLRRNDGNLSKSYISHLQYQ